jgi:SAM-dependent methyltransferase
LPNAHIYGCDASPAAIALAKAKASALSGTVGGAVFDYRVEDRLPLRFPSGAFSHAFSIHPLAAPAERQQIMRELARIVGPFGQALMAMPLRGSFVEIADLLRECALKHGMSELSDSVEAAMQLRPTDELFASEFRAVGFEHVEVDVHRTTLSFEGGRAFFEDPIARTLLVPEFRVNLHLADNSETFDPFGYVSQAIEKYYSGQPFELSVAVGVVSGRRVSG